MKKRWQGKVGQGGGEGEAGAGGAEQTAAGGKREDESGAGITFFKELFSFCLP